MSQQAEKLALPLLEISSSGGAESILKTEKAHTRLFLEESISYSGPTRKRIFIKILNMNFWTQSLISLYSFLEKPLKSILIFMVALYRTAGSQHLGGQCRFHPSCSQYAVESLKTHSVFFALKIIILRILRCQPFGSSGWDPVPPTKGHQS